MSAPESNIPQDEFRLLDFFIVLAKRCPVIIWVSAAVIILTYLFLFCSPNQYTAQARFLPPQKNMTLTAQLLDSLSTTGIPGKGRAGDLGNMAAGLLDLKSPGQLYVAIMKGDTIFDQMIDRFNLRERYKVKVIEAARKRLAENAKIRADKEGLITVAVTATDPKLAAAMANAFVEELDRLLQRIGVQEARDRLVFLEKEREQANLRLTKAEEALRTFSEQNSVLEIDAQTRGMLEYIANLRAAIDTKEVQIQVLRKQATPNNYDVILMETELKGLKEKLRMAESQWDQTCVGDVCLPASRVPTLGLEYLRLYRNVKFQEGLYQLFTKMSEIARLDVVKDVAVVQVVDRAKPPETRANRRLLPSLLAGVVAFFLLVFAAFGQEYLQRANNRDEDAQRLSVLRGYWQQYTGKFTKLTDRIRVSR